MLEIETGRSVSLVSKESGNIFLRQHHLLYQILKIRRLDAYTLLRRIRDRSASATSQVSSHRTGPGTDGTGVTYYV